jgi:hypothetical protein
VQWKKNLGATIKDFSLGCFTHDEGIAHSE